VRWVILTHLHQDHEGGLQYFPNAEFLVSRTEWQAAQGLSGRMAGYLNWRWPKGFTPTLVDFDSGSYHNFASSQMVTRAGDIRLLPTPGHSLGHMSVVVEQSDHILFVAGDAAYTQDLLLRDCIDGVGPSPDDQHETHQQIIRLAAQTPMVFLPSHDPDSAARLEWHETISMEALSVSLSQRPLFD
jgi:glyoxylase-like metal-dependent hydrolase (beta-lactamase superfamily II)